MLTVYTHQIDVLAATSFQYYCGNENNSKTYHNPKTNPARNKIVVFVSFETFRLSCGELVEQVRTLKIVIGTI